MKKEIMDPLVITSIILFCGLLMCWVGYESGKIEMRIIDTNHFHNSIKNVCEEMCSEFARARYITCNKDCKKALNRVFE